MPSRNPAASGKASTPLVSGDNRHAPQYGQLLGKEASRIWYIADEDYC